MALKGESVGREFKEKSFLKTNRKNYEYNYDRIFNKPKEDKVTVDFAKIKALREELNQLLNEHPELKLLQRRIDKLMAGAGNKHNRCVLTQDLMLDSLKRMGEALESLIQEVNKSGLGKR